MRKRHVNMMDEALKLKRGMSKDKNPFDVPAKPIDNYSYNQAIDNAISVIRGTSFPGSGVAGIQTISESLKSPKNSIIAKLESLKKQS